MQKEVLLRCLTNQISKLKNKYPRSNRQGIGHARPDFIGRHPVFGFPLKACGNDDASVGSTTS